jgi:hypothetical protein
MLKSALMLTVVGVGAVGCVDAKGSFDQFSDRVGFVDASTIDGMSGGIHDVSGTFLYVTRAGFESSNNPDFYIEFILRATLTINGDTATYMGNLTPLCKFQTCTERYEIPPPLPASTATVAADGTFTSTFGGTMPGGSNPFSGTDQPLNAVAAGTILSPDFFCGTVSGSAAGLDLAGSTFAAYRITDTTPANLPRMPAACPSGGADAGVDAPPIDAAVDAAATASSWSASTCSPTATARDETVPATAAFTGCSIFIASRMRSVAPGSTTSPTPTRTFTTLPGIGATRLPGATSALRSGKRGSCTRSTAHPSPLTCTRSS